MSKNILLVAFCALCSFSTLAGPAENFKRLDVDSSGHIDITEWAAKWQKYFKNKGIDNRERQMKMLNKSYKKWDLDADGKLTESEFVEGVMSRKKK